MYIRRDYIKEFDRIKEISYSYSREKDSDKKEELTTELFKILDDLKEKAIDKFKNESDIKKFLDNLVRFNQYSYNNQLLIYLQNPDASYVASLRSFNQMGYRINVKD